MGWPTDKVSEFFGRGLWGWATSTWERLTSDGSGSLNVHIKSQTGTQLIQQVMPTLLKPGIHTYIGGSWEKQPMIWGYSDRLSQRVSYTTLAGGDYTMAFSAVPAGSVYSLNSVTSRNNTTAVQQEYLLWDGSNWFPIHPYGTPGANVFRMSGYLDFALKAGDYLAIIFRGNALGDVLTGLIWGSKMAVA